MPVASSSVRLALRTRSELPKCSTNFRTRVGPSPGVSASASQQVASLEAEFSAATAGVGIFPDARRGGKMLSMMALTPVLLEFVKQ